MEDITSGLMHESKHWWGQAYWNCENIFKFQRFELSDVSNSFLIFSKYTDTRLFKELDRSCKHINAYYIWYSITFEGIIKLNKLSQHKKPVTLLHSLVSLEQIKQEVSKDLSSKLYWVGTVTRYEFWNQWNQLLLGELLEFPLYFYNIYKSAHTAKVIHFMGHWLFK